MKTSDPRVRIVFVYRFNSNVHSIFPLQVTGFDFLGKVYSRHATDSVNCENTSVSFVMKYCPTPTAVRNPASVQFLVTRFCCESLSTRSWYFCNRSSCAGSSVEGFRQWVGLSCQNRSPRSYVAGFIFLTQIWDCSVDTELVNTNNCAKNSFNRSSISAEVHW